MNQPTREQLQEDIIKLGYRALNNAFEREIDNQLAEGLTMENFNFTGHTIPVTPRSTEVFVVFTVQYAEREDSTPGDQYYWYDYMASLSCSKEIESLHRSIQLSIVKQLALKPEKERLTEVVRQVHYPILLNDSLVIPFTILLPLD